MAHFLGFKILIFNIFWGFQKKRIFFRGMKILWIFLGSHHKTETIFFFFFFWGGGGGGGHFYAF